MNDLVETGLFVIHREFRETQQRTKMALRFEVIIDINLTEGSVGNSLNTLYDLDCIILVPVWTDQKLIPGLLSAAAINTSQAPWRSICPQRASPAHKRHCSSI